MFSYDTICNNQARFQHTLAEHDFIFKIAAEECLASLPELNITPQSILILGHFSLFDSLQETYPSAVVEYHPTFQPTIDTNKTYDLVISIGQLQWINDPVQYLQSIQSVLTPHGVFYGACVGEDSFKGLHSALVKADMVLQKGASQRVIPMISASDALMLMQAAKFSNPLVHVVSLELQHNSIFDLMNDIRYMGGSNPLHDRSKQFAPKKLFSLANSYLKERKGHIESAVDLIIMIHHN